MNRFIGRRTELGLLNDLLQPVETGGRSGRPGRAVLIRGRRRVGKSRLVEEFLERAELPHVFFTAVGGSREEDLAGFAAEVTASSLPDASRFADFTAPQTWDAALSLLATALPTDAPSVVVLDEMPYLVREDPAFEGALQKAFDRTLSKLPVLSIRKRPGCCRLPSQRVIFRSASPVASGDLGRSPVLNGSFVAWVPQPRPPAIVTPP